ncbi:MAG: bifunctional 4-hydroxy-2-oxoglutarate aldolase/2-dehydro-3-deoxy-phosphogluconate aldolase [Clostridiaceae bacterium]
MNKQEVKEALRGKLIAVVRQENPKIAKTLCRVLVESGIDVLEITFSVNNAEKLIKDLKEEFPDAIIGAGTVLSEEQAELAVKNGAQFVVSPCIIDEVGEYCRKNNVCFSLGAATPTEAYKAYKLGCDVVKLFPGDCISPKMIKGIKAPLPFIEMMPTGGVNDKNIKEWFEAGAYAAGFGGYLFNGIGENNIDVLKERCRHLIEAYNK